MSLKPVPVVWHWGVPTRWGLCAPSRRANWGTLALPEPPTAVPVDNRLAGVGAVHAALQAGCVLGQDVSLIVYDGLGTDSVIRQAITSIDPPAPSLVGLVLAELLLARLRGEAPETLQRVRMPVLVVGDSDGPPRG